MIGKKKRKDLRKSQSPIILTGVDTDSETSTVLSDLSEDHDVPELENEKGLLAWLATGQRNLDEKLAKFKIHAAVSLRKVRGVYKRKGTTQSKRTQQHNTKKIHDATAKARADGFGDIRDMFRKAARSTAPLVVESDSSDSGSDLEEIVGWCNAEVGNMDEEVMSQGDDGSEAPASEEAEDGDVVDGMIMTEQMLQEEDGLGEMPDIVLMMNSKPKPWEPRVTMGHFYAAPGRNDVERCPTVLENTINPRRKTGHGHKDPHLNLVLRARLETMASFLRLYRRNGYTDWTASSELAAEAAGKGSWLARRLREWTHALIRDETDLPTHSYGKFNSSILEDEDLADEINLHLQSLGPWFTSYDVVRFLATPEMQARLKLKKPITDRSARRWLGRMSWRWTKKPKGQYKDGHEREDIVSDRQEQFIPEMDSIEPFLTKWAPDGSAIPDDIPDDQRIMLWSHDESTYYANDR